MTGPRRLVVFGLGLALAGVGLVVSTHSAMGVPPSPAGLVGLAGVTGLAAVLSSLRSDRLGGRGGLMVLVLLFVALGAVAGQDFLRPGVAKGHDVTHHAWAYWSLWRSVLDGDLYPRWNPYLGLGMPLLQFYCPLGYLAAWPAQLLGASPLQAMAFVVVALQFVGAWAAYASLRWLGGSLAAGLVAAFALALAPYHLLDQNFRVALGETLALAWLVPAMAAGWKVSRGDRGLGPWVLGVSLVLLLLTHLTSLIMVCFALLLIFLVARIPRGGARPGWASTFGVLVLSGCLAGAASAAWWLPVLVEQEHTSLSRLSRPGRAISPLAATLDEPLRRQLWSRYGVRWSLKKLWKLQESASSDADPRVAAQLERELTRRRGMPMYFGWGMTFLLLLGIAGPRAASSEQGVCSRRLGLVGLVLLLLAIYPMARLIDGVPLLGRIMFPWRLYAPATALAALSGGLALDSWLGLSGRLRALFVAGVLALLAVDSAPYLGAAERFPSPGSEGFWVFAAGEKVPAEVERGRFVRIEEAPLPPADYDWQVAKSRWVFSEYMAVPLRKRYGKLSRPPSIRTSEFFGASVRFSPYSARRIELAPEPILEFQPDSGDWAALPAGSWARRPERIDIKMPSGLSDGQVRFKEAWFPGWQVRLDAGAWEATQPSQEHLLEVFVPRGTERVSFRYGFWRPWDRPVGLGVSLVTLGGLVLIRRRQRRAASPA